MVLGTGVRVPPPQLLARRYQGRLDADAKFFTTGDVEKIVYCATSAADAARDKLGAVATVVGGGGDPVDLAWLVEDLHAQVAVLAEVCRREFGVPLRSG